MYVSVQTSNEFVLLQIKTHFLLFTCEKAKYVNLETTTFANSAK